MHYELFCFAFWHLFSERRSARQVDNCLTAERRLRLRTHVASALLSIDRPRLLFSSHNNDKSNCFDVGVLGFQVVLGGARNHRPILPDNEKEGLFLVQAC